VRDYLRDGAAAGALREPARDGVAAPLVVELLGVVVFGQKVVVEENKVVLARREKLYRARGVCGHVERIARELLREPLVAQHVVVEQKDAQRLARREHVAESNLIQKTLQYAHACANGAAARKLTWRTRAARAEYITGVSGRVQAASFALGACTKGHGRGMLLTPATRRERPMQKCSYCARPLRGLRCLACRRYVPRRIHIVLLTLIIAAAVLVLLELFLRIT
jgi:hypothetical protein